MPAASKATWLASWLQRQITSGAWPVNSRIPTEAEIATQHLVGRSTVREATRSVALLGMLESLPGRGTFVRSANPANPMLARGFAQRTAAELQVLRRALEAEAASLAALHRTDDELAAIDAAAGLSEPCHPLSTFHRLVFEAARTPLLLELHRSLPLADAGTSSHPDPRPDHRRIVRAIRNRDPVKARAAAVRHAEHGPSAGPIGAQPLATVTEHPLGRRLAPPRPDRIASVG